MKLFNYTYMDKNFLKNLTGEIYTNNDKAIKKAGESFYSPPP
jgi:hypothetical protein